MKTKCGHRTGGARVPSRLLRQMLAYLDMWLNPIQCACKPISTQFQNPVFRPIILDSTDFSDVLLHVLSLSSLYYVVFILQLTFPCSRAMNLTFHWLCLPWRISVYIPTRTNSYWIKFLSVTRGHLYLPN